MRPAVTLSSTRGNGDHRVSLDPSSCPFLGGLPTSPSTVSPFLSITNIKKGDKEGTVVVSIAGARTYRLAGLFSRSRVDLKKRLALPSFFPGGLSPCGGSTVARAMASPCERVSVFFSIR
ncbi:unnamed protein product [Chondrus crispus]|uniref:Uncharacterized protein n=1 Tax=Chondrus crispus TaxID=2769 RepID=R7QNR2_CHOCR|nr:unnamed protein product [Chondrus crispus]CDF39116.1 unnamed protein product [Chondrus crispus]|eukprot:XP_005719027.1 unnamed protein product [Chondrus crispus]